MNALTDPTSLDLVRRYRSRASDLRRAAAEPGNLRRRSLLLYAACECDCLADGMAGCEPAFPGDDGIAAPPLPSVRDRVASRYAGFWTRH